MAVAAGDGHNGAVRNAQQPLTEPGPMAVSSRPGVGLAVAIGLLVTVAGALAFEPRLHDLGVTGFVERFNVFRALGAVGFGLSGSFVVAVRPRHRVGWLLAGVGGALALSLLLANYGLAGINDPDGSLPGQRWAMWVSEWLWAPAYWLMATLLLAIFPTGQLLSRRWRPVAVAAVTASALNMVGWALLPPEDNDVVGMFPAGYEGPVPSSSIAAEVALSLGLVVGVSTVAASLVALVQRYRRAAGVERQQLEWVLVAAIAMVVVLVVAGASPAPLGPVLNGVAMLPLPAAMAVAVVQHRLWDIDVVFSRSLLFAVLTAAVLAVYGLSVLVVGEALGSQTGAPLVATAVVAVGIQPVHQRVRRLVNRMVYGERNDPAAALRHLGTRLGGVGASGDVLVDVANSVARALRVPYVAVVEAGMPTASWGSPVPTVEQVALSHRGREVGTLVVGVAAGDRLRPSDERALAALAPHVAVAVEAHRLNQDLERSRQRLLAARADERQRLRREMHDGLGPTLAALALAVDRGRVLVGSDPDTASRLLDSLSGRIRETVGALRAIVDDLRPPPLDELGLAGAVRELACRLRDDLDVTVTSPPVLPPVPADVELAAYRIAAEAITNAVRHAGGTRCWVTLNVDKHAEIHVEDDGGGIPCDHREGVGIASMRQRVDELGGTLTIATRRSGGTSVLATLPVPARSQQ